jgi:hypothetical protein
MNFVTEKHKLFSDSSYTCTNEMLKLKRRWVDGLTGGGAGVKEYNHWLVTYIDIKAKCRHKKLARKGTLRQVLICLRPPPLLGFCLGWFSNFLGSESGQILSVKLLQNMVSNRTPYPRPLPNTVHLFTQWRGGGRSWTRKKVRGAQFTKLRRKYQHDWLYLRSTV